MSEEYDDEIEETSIFDPIYNDLAETADEDLYCEECGEELGEDEDENVICANEECGKFMVVINIEDES